MYVLCIENLLLMKSTILYSLSLLIAFGTYSQDHSADKEWQNTWTYTYLKAREDQRNNLKAFISKNWFAMDSIAVQRGLFNDYQLLENTNKSTDAEWDFIVAVEYYTKGTYEDIREEWMKIRSDHKPVAIEGYAFPDLGHIVKSETLTVSPETNSAICQGEQFEILKPFMGRWQEYLVEGAEEKRYGILSIALSPESCSLTKNFSMLTSSFSYRTLGYYDRNSETWKETYTFSHGGYAIYEWKTVNNEVVMELISSAASSKKRRRNRWIKVKKNDFFIVAEESADAGKTWSQISETHMKRIGQ